MPVRASPTATMRASGLLFLCAFLAPFAAGFPLWRRNETRRWRAYFSPFGPNSVYFHPDRVTNPDLKLYIGFAWGNDENESGVGRTGTTSVTKMFESQNIQALHWVKPLRRLPFATLRPGVVARLFRKARGQLAVLDHPVGVYTWELMSAYPQYTVLHSVRTCDAWMLSRWHRHLEIHERRKQLAHQGHFVPKTSALVETDQVFGHALEPYEEGNRTFIRRYFEINSKVLNTVPEDRLFVMDVTARNSSVPMERMLNTTIAEIPHAHDSKASLKHKVTPALHYTGGPAIIDPKSNPADLNLAAVTTLVPMEGYPNPSNIFFAPGRLTSDAPLVIAAGFPGTGLDTLASVYKVVGKGQVLNPIVDVAADYANNRVTSKYQPPPGGKLDALKRHGLQSRHVTPAHFEGVGIIMGMPVPLIVFDFLEAFPNAKVILTVRRPEQWMAALRRDLPRGFEEHGNVAYSQMMSLWAWGVGPQQPTGLIKVRTLRRYLTHNTNIIHGVPKAQLLVWDPHQAPSWEPVCNFLGVPVPTAPFPKPKEGKFLKRASWKQQ